MVKRRLGWLAAIILVWGGAIFYKLISLEIVHHQEYVDEARAHQEAGLEIAAPRGTLFDRTGQPLALSVPSHSVFVNPQKIDLEYASSILAGELHLDRAELYRDMKTYRDRGRGYYRVKLKIGDEEWQELRKLKAGSSQFDWIQVEPASRRQYPNGTLAAHVLGSVDSEEKGEAGIERALDKELRGTPGRLRELTDAKGRGIESYQVTDPRTGTPLTLTIDARIQFVMERELAAAVVEHNAVSGSAVAMNPNTGEILALASYPSYDPNERPKSGEDLAARQNHACQAPFEPGSVFKVITMSAALETTSLKPESIINCHGNVLKLPGRIIHDSHLGYGAMPMWEVLAKSSNVGAIQVGLQVGQENMYEYVRRFGFGRRTGVELPAESPGTFHKLSRWGKTSLASIAFGHEVGVTTIQLAQAASVIANGGLLVKPTLILKRDGRPAAMQQPVRVLKPETAITMRRMMETVVQKGGTGTKAALAGYSVGGKTGSATIFDYATKHYTHTYNGSFLGFAPLGNPAIVVVVTINGTHGTAGFGGAAAAPVFKAIATEALRIMDVPKDLPEESPTRTLVAALDDAPPEDTGGDETNALQDDADDEGPGAQPQTPGPKVPNFKGMTMRAVMEQAIRDGLDVVPDGNGVARAQDPPPGSQLAPDARIRVVFAR